MRKLSSYILVMALLVGISTLPCRADDVSDTVRLVQQINGDLSFGSVGEIESSGDASVSEGDADRPEYAPSDDPTLIPHNKLTIPVNEGH